MMVFKFLTKFKVLKKNYLDHNFLSKLYYYYFKTLIDIKILLILITYLKNFSQIFSKYLQNYYKAIRILIQHFIHKI
jgi:hypothetical protein